jgi:SagB-type dehydrogenase family enzyme
MTSGIGDRYQEETKYARDKLPGGSLDWRSKPETYKSYPQAVKLKLGPPRKHGGMPIWEAVGKRRSVREFERAAIDGSDLSQLLWASQGVTAADMGYALRAAPSAGALYPVETYISAQMIKGVEPGIYHYNVREHALELVHGGELGRRIASAALDQDFLADGAVVFAWTAVFGRSKWKYRERAYRYVYLDAGHIAQNVALTAAALGLGSCQIAALYDDEVNALLGVDGKEESILYMTVVGTPCQRR